MTGINRQHIINHRLQYDLDSQKIKPNTLHLTSIKGIVKNIAQGKQNIVTENDIPYQNSHMTCSWATYLKSVISHKVHSKHWRHIQALKLSNEQSEPWHKPDITQNTFNDLISIVVDNFPNLKMLDLRFHYWLDIDDKALYTLAVQIGRKLVNLEHLSLSFKSCDTITGQGIERFVKGISRNLTRLTGLNLDFRPKHPRSVLTDKGLKAISSEISKYLVNLRSLSLDFENQEGISYKGIEKFASKISQNLTMLQALRFRFTHQLVTEECLERLLNPICANLTKLKYLQFTLNYLDNTPSRSFWFILAEISQHLVHLEHLDFNFSNSEKATVEGIDAYNIHQLTSLKTLVLKLSGAVISEESLLLLTSTITEKFPSLEQFAVKFMHNTGIFDSLSSNSLEALIFDTSRSLYNLHTLKIDIPRCRLTSDNWKQWLDSNNQEPLLNLKHLTLVFSNCENTSDDFLEALGTRIASFLVSLESLTIEMKWCQTTAQAYEAFWTRISEKLVHLKSVKIETTISNYRCKGSVKRMLHYVPNLDITP